VLRTYDLLVTPHQFLGLRIIGKPVNNPRCVGRRRCTWRACHVQREQTRYSSWPTSQPSKRPAPRS
jgi:hypothetical protein